MIRIVLLPTAALLASTLPASASSGDAWAEFAAKVKKECLAAAVGSLEKPAIAVDPFGTESYGVAVLSGKPRGAKGSVSYLCVMDKQSGKAELGSELGTDVLTVKIGK